MVTGTEEGYTDDNPTYLAINKTNTNFYFRYYSANGGYRVRNAGTGYWIAVGS